MIKFRPNIAANIVIANEKLAKNILDELNEYIADYSFVSEKDFCELLYDYTDGEIDIPRNYQMKCFGWTDLSEAVILPRTNARVSLCLPRSRPIDEKIVDKMEFEMLRVDERTAQRVFCIGDIEYLEVMARLQSYQKSYEYADLNHILHNTSRLQLIDADVITYDYCPDGVRFRYEDHLDYGTIYDGKNTVEKVLLIIRNLADLVEKAIGDKRKEDIMLNDTNLEIGRIFEELQKIGGSMSVETSGGYDGVAHIDLPLYSLDSIKFRSPGMPPFNENTSSKRVTIPMVSRVDTYNNKVVKVTFMDGTFTKAVCSENDEFNLDVGISICLTKRMLHKDSHESTKMYANMMHDVHKKMEENEKKREEEKARVAKEKSDRRKANLKRAAKNLKAKQEQIDIQRTAFVEAMREAKMTLGDDGK